MRYFLLLLTACFLTVSASAQSTEDSVKAAVNKLFTAMKESDEVMLKNSFTSNAVLQTIGRSKETGAVVVTSEEVNAFAESIQKITKGDADEQIVFETIKIDGDLASVWTPYKFYYKGKFSHCGVNSFQLVRLNGEWKIQYIIDTRRRLGCQ
ncbi:MAG: nuclear transport factor 2 family protein [Chitinophagales bacterium]|nr:nuclear transport factor 2 family protein [Chitinophagales bacterium]